MKRISTTSWRGSIFLMKQNGHSNNSLRGALRQSAWKMLRQVEHTVDVFDMYEVKHKHFLLSLISSRTVPILLLGGYS